MSTHEIRDAKSFLAIGTAVLLLLNNLRIASIATISLRTLFPCFILQKGNARTTRVKQVPG